MKYYRNQDRFRLTFFLLILLVSGVAKAASYTPPEKSVSVLKGIDFSRATPIDETYRAQFERCDREDIFNGKTMKGFRRCTPDKNRVKALLRFPDNTVFFEAKLSLDIDGSFKACNDPGLADQCPTWFEWDNLPKPGRYVDPDRFPFIVIPIAGLEGHGDKEFRNKTGVDKGDLGVVIYKDKIVPVFVADGGPHNKLGEGSSALFQALGEDRCLKRRTDGHCTKYKDFSITDKVLFFIFPKSKLEDLNPDNALEKIRIQALQRLNQLK